MMVIGMEEVDPETPPLPHPPHLTAKNPSVTATPPPGQGHRPGTAGKHLDQAAPACLRPICQKTREGTPHPGCYFFPQKSFRILPLPSGFWPLLPEKVSRPTRTLLIVFPCYQMDVTLAGVGVALRVST